MMEIRNPQYTATGSIDCEINHPELGWLPFTASPGDTEARGREVFAAAEAMGPAPYEGPPPPDPLEAERAAMRVSRLQARAALLQAGLLDKVDRAVSGGMFGGGTSDAILKMAWTEAAEFNRTSPTIAALAGLVGPDDAALDDLFRAAAQIRF